MRDAPSATPETRFAPRGCLSLFFLVFFLAGLSVLVAVVRSVHSTVRVWTWPAVSCTVESSSVAMTEAKGERPFRATVRVGYAWEGQARTASHEAGFRDYAKAARHAGRYIPGLAVPCFVDPRRPENSAISRDAPWSILFVLVPLAILAIGAGGLYGIWFSRPDRNRPKPLSQPKRGQRYLAAGAGAVFAVVGGALYLTLCHDTLRDWLGAHAWPETECLIEASRLSVEDTDDGTGYRADFLYRYARGGREYRASRVRFRLTSGKRREEQALLRQYPVGQTVRCYADPSDPQRATIERGFDASLLFAAIPLGFFVVGTLLLAGGIRSAPQPPPAPAPDGPTVLRRQSGPVHRLMGCGCLTLIWNGAMAAFAWRIAADWMRGRPDWPSTLFASPFVLIGLAGVGSVLYFALSLLNPRLEIRVSRGRARPGDTVLIEWQLLGRQERVRRLDLVFTGREESTYRRGTDTTKESETFLRVPIVQGVHGGRGAFHLTIPACAMHSFDAPSNKVIWSFEAKGEIRGWPDLKEDYPYTIVPAGRRGWS